jgi:hypothetical protein
VTPQCFGINGVGYVYVITIQNSGTVPIPVNSSVFLGFKDASRLTYFGFNTTLPQALVPGQTASLNSTSWPRYVNATSKLAPGDVVGMGIVVGSAQTGITAHVLSCTTSATTVVNASQTQTGHYTTCG